MSPTEDARPNREQAARGGRGAASSFWPPKGRQRCRRDRGPPGGGHMPCESRKVTLPSDVSRRAKVTANWGSPSGRRVGNPGPGSVSREQAEGRERAVSRSRGSERTRRKAVARPSGPPGWCRETTATKAATSNCDRWFAGGRGWETGPARLRGRTWRGERRTPTGKRRSGPVRRRDDDGRAGYARGLVEGCGPLRPYFGEGQQGKGGSANTCRPAFRPDAARPCWRGFGSSDQFFEGRTRGV